MPLPHKLIPLSALLLALAACQPASAPASASASTVAAAPSPHQKAIDAVSALPELKAWAAQIEKESGGKRHGAVIEYDPKPALIDGKSYYQISFVENGPDAAHRLEDFLVDAASGEVKVMDFASGAPIPLEQWRKERTPPNSNQATGG